MASEVQSVTNPASSLVHGSQALTTTIVIPNGGKSLPQNGNAAAPAAGSSTPAAPQQAVLQFAQSAQTSQLQADSPVQAAHSGQAAQQAAAALQAQAAQQGQESKQASTSSLPAQIATLNKYLNDSGRPAQFRASSDDRNIEEINPATGEVIAQYSASEFAALARSVGISGAVVNSHA